MLLRCVEWRLFCLIFWCAQKGGSVGGQFPKIFGWTPCRAAQSLGRFAEDLRRRKLDGEDCVFIYLLVNYLFIYSFFVCLLFNYFEGASCWVMSQLCGLAMLEKGKRGWVAISVEFCGGFDYYYFIILWVWWKMWCKACLHF